MCHRFPCLMCVNMFECSKALLLAMFDLPKIKMFPTVSTGSLHAFCLLFKCVNRFGWEWNFSSLCKRFILPFSLYHINWGHTCVNMYFQYTSVARVIGTTDGSENIKPFFSYFQNMISFHNVHERFRWSLWAEQISVSPTVLIHLYLYSHSISNAAANFSGINFLRTSTLKLSLAFCYSNQRLSFECAKDLLSLFSDLPQICSMGSILDFEGASQSFSMFK